LLIHHQGTAYRSNGKVAYTSSGTHISTMGKTIYIIWDIYDSMGKVANKASLTSLGKRN
jgi:hypothetical protein